MKHIRHIQPLHIAGSLIVVIGLLASIAAVWPEEGVTVAGTQLSYPTLSEVLSSPEEAEPQLSPEELLAQQEAELHASEEQGFLSFLRTSTNRIHFPGDDYTYLDTVFRALEGADTIPVRIVHYGDSQLEEDRLSCNLRRALHAEFGGGGTGLVPVQQSLYSQTINLSGNREWTKYTVFGPATARREASYLYGPMGAVNILDSVSWISISPKRQRGQTNQTDSNSCHYFNRMTLLTRSTGGIRVGLGGQNTLIPATSEKLQFTRFDLPDSTTSIRLTLNGAGDIYGMMLDNATGVQVDNIPMRGCSGTVFTGIDRQQLITYFRETNTRLIILQFGGNSMPYLKSEKAVDQYIEKLRKQLQHLQQLAPEARFIWVGPSDMTTRINGKLQTYPMLGYTDQAICRMVNQEGCAYWSLYEAMGGAGSMIRWAGMNPPLAGQDYVHFTRRGATQAGELLTNSFLFCYRYYQFRQ